jgi:hypothetical protein
MKSEQVTDNGVSLNIGLASVVGFGSGSAVHSAAGGFSGIGTESKWPQLGGGEEAFIVISQV